MGLSADLISQFAKMTKEEKKEKVETTVYGTTVKYDGRIYVKLDGSELLTPVSTTSNMKAGERVTVLLKNHTAIVTGNITSPSVSSSDIGNIDEKIAELEKISVDAVTTEELDAEKARIDKLEADNVTIKNNLTAAEADINTLEADNVTIRNSLSAAEADIDTLEANDVAINETLTAQSARIDSLDTTKLDASIADITYATITSLDATNAEITNLESTFGDFRSVTTNNIAANKAGIESLQANKLSASDIEGKYANIDFSNIGKAAMQHFYSESGLIQNVVIGDTTITGNLVGVTISGDLIEGNTIKAEKLVIKGTDGLYYKLNTDGITTEAEQTDYNSLDGQLIQAKTITASKITVDDLVAFDATIGGFNITNSAIYSGVKESVNNTTSGIYMDKTGQMAIGDASNFIKYYKDQNGDYRLEISAQSVNMSTSDTTVEEAISALSESTTNTAQDLANYISATNSEIESLQDQIDGSIMTWFYEYEPTNSNIPASEWTTIDEKNIHLGDLFYNTVTGYCYRWQVLNNVYSWKLVKDVDITKAISDAAKAQDTADNKRRVFVSTPTVPYDIGDLWVQGSSGDIMKCSTTKTSSQSYSSSDWSKASKYTDDTKANAAQSAANAAQAGVDALEIRMSSAETEISQNKEAISLRATKTEVIETLSGYYTKEQADSALTIKANEITSNVSSTYATKTALATTNSNVTEAKNAADKAQQTVDSLEIGGRNYILNSDIWVSNGSTANGITQSINNGVKKIVSTSGNGNWNSFTRDNVIEDNFKTGDTFTFAVEIKSDDATVPPSIYFKSGMGYYPMKGSVSTEYSWCYYTGTWNDTNNISFHFGWQNAIGTYYLRRLLFVKGNKLLDWSAAPEDIESDISAIETRVTNAETNITQNSKDILLRATKTEVSTAKSEAISTAASDATTKANSAKSAAISTAASDATTKADNALAAAKTYADAQIKVSADSITSTVNSVKTTAETANSYVTNAKNNYGYQYKKNIVINGDSSKYYPVLILGGDQNVMREIMIKRTYSDTAPEDWNGHPTSKGISLLLKIKCNFGGWGGANYSWAIHDLEEMYGNVFAGASNVMANMGFVIFLRGGGETGAFYSIFSDQQLSREYMNGYSVRVCYEQERIGWTGGTEGNPTHKWNAPAPRTLTDAIKDEIASKKYIDVATSAQNGVNALTTRVTSAETKIQQNIDAIELRATKTELSAVSTAATNAATAAENAQSTADTANSTANTNATNLANNYYTKTQTDAKIKVESDKISSAVSRITANETAISTLEQTADGLEVRLDTTDSNVATAQSTANTANTTANSVKTDLANNYTKKSLPDTRNDNQAPSWYFENYPKQIITEFKYCSKIGLSGVGTYCTLQTIVPWNDSSGGYPKQTAKVETTGKEFWRVGTSATAWSDWIDAYGLASTANSTANTAKTNAANAAKTATNFLSYDSTNGLLIGNKTSGSWSGARAQIKSNAFNVLDQNGVTLASYGTTTTIGKTTGNNVYIDSDSIDIRKNGKILATFDQYGLKIANTNDSSGSLGSGTTKPALVIGTPTGYHIEMDNNEIMAKSDATTSSHLFLNMEGGNVSFNNNANRAMMFQEGALYAKNASFYDGNYLGVLDALNDAGNTALGYGGYINKIGGTNIYGNSISLVSNGDINVEASWIRCRSIAPNDHATYALGVYGEKGWSNIYLGKGDNKTNALHIIAGSSTYLLCGVNSSGQYVFGNNAAVMYYQAKDVGTDNTGNSFKITSGNNTASNNTNSVWLFGGADTTSRYIGSYMAYSRTYSSSANMCVTANGVFGRSTSSSERYKNSIVEADISELKALYNLPVKKFKYNLDYISSDDELYDKYLFGFLAEDVEDVLPCAVEHIIDEEGNAIPEMWNSNIIVPVLLKLIQDLNNRVNALETATFEIDSNGDLYRVTADV